MQTSLTLAMLVLFCPWAIGAEGDEPADLRTRKDGSDWPRFLGPMCNGSSPEKGILTAWPKAGLKVVWQAPLGEGFAPPVVSKGRLFHFDRSGEKARLTCRNTETGKELWKFEYSTTYEDMYGYSPGPRACPVVDGGRVYIYGVEGMLDCIDVTTGKEIWKKDIKAAYHFHQNFFGVGSVPFVEGDLLIVAVGGSPKGVVDNLSEAIRTAKGNGTAIVAFDKKTGEEKYRTSDELASYSSPIVAKVGEQRLGLYFARGGLVAFDPATGKVDFEYKYRARTFESVNAATPVVVGDKVLISECYEHGSVLLKVEPGKATAIWSDAERDRRGKALRCHWNTPIYVDGYIYGCSGRHENEAELRCVDFMTGKVAWSEPGLERTQLTLVDGHFVALTERGELMLIKVNPKKCEIVSRYEVEGLNYPSWAAPVISHGLLYIRGKDRLLALELIPAKP